MPATLIKRTTTVEEFSNEEPEEIHCAAWRRVVEERVEDGKAKREGPKEHADGKAGGRNR